MRHRTYGPLTEQVRASIMNESFLDFVVDEALANDVLGRPSAKGKRVRQLRDDERLVLIIAQTLAWADTKDPTGPHHAEPRAQRRRQRFGR